VDVAGGTVLSAMDIRVCAARCAAEGGVMSALIAMEGTTNAGIVAVMAPSIATAVPGLVPSIAPVAVVPVTSPAASVARQESKSGTAPTVVVRAK